MRQKYKIAIAGIGGVGGFYGSALATAYEHSPEIEISFVARGAHMLAIKEKGLQLEKDQGTITAHPCNITDRPEELGPLNLIVFCCKAYSLESLALSFSDNITDETVLLPLLNGVDSTDILQGLFPHAKTIYGCTYLFAKKIADGIIKQTGDLNQLLIGSPTVDRQELDRIKEFFCQAGVNAEVYDDIKLKLWEKYSFISPMATATSALNSPVGDILDNDGKKGTLQKLMEEVVLLSGYEGIVLPDNIIELNWNKLAKLPKEATSSMHHDFMGNKNTELEVITGYVVKQSEKLGVDVPAYESLYSLLKARVPR